MTEEKVDCFISKCLSNLTKRYKLIIAFMAFFAKRQVSKKGKGIMKSFSYVITDNEGIHARPAGELVKLCKTFKSDITIAKDGQSGKATKILSVMSLGATKGSTVEFTIEGEDEETAAAAVEAFMKENL